MSHSLRWVISFAFGKSAGSGPASPSIGSLEPSVKRTSWTCRWSKLMKSTSSGATPAFASASGTGL